MARMTFGDFSIEAGPTWGLSSVVLTGAPDGAGTGGLRSVKGVPPFQKNLVATLEPIGPREGPEDYHRRLVKGLEEAQVPREGVGTPERVALKSGHPALLAEQVITGHGGQRVRQMQLIVVKDGFAYTALISHLDGPPFEAHREEFRTMLLSFA